MIVKLGVEEKHIKNIIKHDLKMNFSLGEKLIAVRIKDIGIRIKCN
jgi:hypothetical protein